MSGGEAPASNSLYGGYGSSEVQHYARALSQTYTCAPEIAALNIPGHPYLSSLLDRDEAWALLGDFDGLMRASDERIRSADGLSNTVEAAKRMHDFARDHYHLLLVAEFRIREIGRGIRAALDSKNETALFNLTRAFIEHTAALAYQISMLEKAMNEFQKTTGFEGLRETIVRHHRAARRLYFNKEGAVHVHDMIKALSKHHESARREYDELCEFVHPNYGSSRLVASGKLGTGQIRSHAEELWPELFKVHQIIERCAMLADDEFNKTSTYLLTKLGSWIEIACQDGTKLSQVFSLRGAASGDGRTKETAIFFKKARTHQEAVEAFYDYLRVEKLDMMSQRTATIENGFLYDEVITSKGPLWVKYKLPS